jgi:hypothetical protein
VPEGIPAELKPGGGMGLNITQVADGQNTSSVLIDAKTGAVLRETVRSEHATVMQQIKGTVSVCPFNAAIAPWPYDENVPSDMKREIWGNISYPAPDPRSGIVVQQYIGDPGGSSILVWNGRSHLGVIIDHSTGKLMKGSEEIVSEDVEAFERYFAEVKLCGADIQC